MEITYQCVSVGFSYSFFLKGQLEKKEGKPERKCQVIHKIVKKVVF